MDEEEKRKVSNTKLCSYRQITDLFIFFTKYSNSAYRGKKRHPGRQRYDRSLSQTASPSRHSNCICHFAYGIAKELLLQAHRSSHSPFYCLVCFTLSSSPAPTTKALYCTDELRNNLSAPLLEGHRQCNIEHSSKKQRHPCGKW
jgi:hypothetical protein